MKEQAFRERLKTLYPDVPEETHRAFCQAVSEHRREKQNMKASHKAKLIPALVLLALALTITAAYAVIDRYSVWQSNFNHGNPAFEQHVITLNEDYENDVLLLNVNDFMFDGLEGEMALNMQSKPGVDYLYIDTVLTAECDGVQYDFDMEGMQGADFLTGFLYPDPADSWQDNGHYSFNGMLWNDEEEELPDGTKPIHWTLTMKVLRPVYEVTVDPGYLDNSLVLHGGEGDDEILAGIRTRVREAYAQKKILVTDDNLFNFVSYILPEGETEESYFAMSKVEQLLCSGAFEMEDTIHCEFYTNIGDCVDHPEFSGQRFDMGEYDLVIDRLRTTFRSVELQAHCVFHEAQTIDELERRCDISAWRLAINTEDTSQAVGVHDGSTFVDNGTIISLHGMWYTDVVPEFLTLTDGNASHTLRLKDN